MNMSVLIATKDRPDQLRQCLESLYTSTHKQFEVIVVDQSINDSGSSLRSQFPRLRYFHYTRGGKSGALNFGSTKARGSILAFTDDDCIVTPGWLTHIHEAFCRHPSAHGVFGSTYPYKPEKHRGEICPSTYEQSHSYAITKPVYHVSHIGFGNNMAIRKQTFIAIGGFARWLGPGTAAMAAEDADIEARLLLSGYGLWYEKSAKLFHNKWMSQKATRTDGLHYLVGETACYGYLALTGHRYARGILQKAWDRDVRQFARYGMRFLTSPRKKYAGSMWWASLQLAARLSGHIVAFGVVLNRTVAHG